jgi:hypothetical protein
MRRGWIPLVVMVILVFVLVALRGNSTANSSPEHASTSDAVDGTSALRAYADALGHPSGAIEGDFTLPSTPGLLFIFTPAGFNGDEAQAINAWLLSGGVLVYASEDGDAALDAQLGLHRSPAATAASVRATAPILGGVDTVQGADRAGAFVPAAAQVPLLRDRSAKVLGVKETVGAGQVIALSDPLILCNGYLPQADNGRLAADLMAMTPAGGRVWFDEFHHGAAARQSPQTAWMTTPWGIALLSVVAILFIGLALRGRSFGPRISLRPSADRSSAEYASAVGSLLHRTGARRLTLETLLAASRRALAEQVGLGADAPRDQLNTALAQRAPVASAELARAERELANPALSETELLLLTKRLHELAYPLSAAERMKETA